MSTFILELDGQRYTADGEALDITIALDFDGEQPNFYSADPASARPMHSGEFIGDTRLGGSCNAEHVDLIAHCNGTHTECVGHLTLERVSVHRRATAPLYVCQVVTVTPETVSASDEHGGTIAEKNDLLITRSALQAGFEKGNYSALAVRTVPNGEDKLSRVYHAGSTAYFSVEAMQWVVDQGIDHLLVDTPSVDRLIDGGRLTTHRIFWGMTGASRSIKDAARPQATITELIYIADDIADGRYLLDLQVAPFISDAAPSRALLHRIVA